MDPDALDNSGIDTAKHEEFEAKQNSHRIRALLLEMEKQSKEHIQEINRIHEHY